MAELSHAPGAPAGAAAAAARLLEHAPALRRMSELQLEQRLRARRRERQRSVTFAWLHGREVGLA